MELYNFRLKTSRIERGFTPFIHIHGIRGEALCTSLLLSGLTVDEVFDLFDRLLVLLHAHELDEGHSFALVSDDLVDGVDERQGVRRVADRDSGVGDQRHAVLHRDRLEHGLRRDLVADVEDLDVPGPHSATDHVVVDHAIGTEGLALSRFQPRELVVQLTDEATDGVTDATTVLDSRAEAKDRSATDDEDDRLENEEGHAHHLIEVTPRHKRGESQQHRHREGDATAEEGVKEAVVLLLLEDHLVVLFGDEVRHAHTPFVLAPAGLRGWTTHVRESFILYHTYAYFAICLRLLTVAKQPTIYLSRLVEQQKGVGDGI